MIEIKNVKKSFGKFTVFENFSLTIDDGSIYGLVGYNGAGKTTLLKTIAGIYKPEEGEILLNSINSYDNGIARKELFYIPDDMYFMSNASINSMAKFYAGMYDNFDFKLLENIVELFKLDINAKIHGFSKGMKRQAEIALGLASRPKIMLLDEIFDGIDPQKRDICRKLFTEYVAEYNCSILMSSHNLEELGNISDHIGLINGKELVINCSIDDIPDENKKYYVEFKEPISIDLISKINGAKQIKIENNNASFMILGKDNLTLADKKLKELGASDIKILPATLEELFIATMEEKPYDIQKIFSK